MRHDGTRGQDDDESCLQRLLIDKLKEIITINYISKYENYLW